MHPRLVEDHVRHFRQAVFDVLNAAAADDLGAPRLVRLPEHRLVDEIGLFQDAIGEAEGLEHLHRATSDAVGLAKLERSSLPLDDRRLDVGKGCELRRERQPGRTAADDEDIDILGAGRPCAARPANGSAIRGSPGLNPSRWNCMALRSFPL